MAAAAATAGRGQVADDIPALPVLDPDAFGTAMATFDGETTASARWSDHLHRSVSKRPHWPCRWPRSATGSGRAWAGSRPGVVPPTGPAGVRTRYPRNPFITPCPRGHRPALSVTGDAAGRCASSCGPSPGTRAGHRPAGRPVRGRAGAPQRRPGPFHRQPRQPAEPGRLGAGPLLHTLRHRGELPRPRPGRAVPVQARAAGGRARSLGRTDAKRMNVVTPTCGNYDAAGELRLPGRAAGQDGSAGPCWP